MPCRGTGIALELHSIGLELRLTEIGYMICSPPAMEMKAALATKTNRPAGWQERREELRRRLAQMPPTECEDDEIEAHFAGMPSHYWESVNEADLVWGLESVRGFLKLLLAAKTPPTMPYMDYRTQPGSTEARVILCTWDRQGLLAKAAAAFSAVRLNIQRAEVFTRSDNVVLDLFHVTNAGGSEPVSEAQMKNMISLLDGALSEPPRFASVWACSRHKYLAERDPIPPSIAIDNHAHAGSTLVKVEAFDRLGLLYDILQTIADSGLNVTQAVIETDNALARDVIHVADSKGKKLADASLINNLKTQLEAALAR